MGKASPREIRERLIRENYMKAKEIKKEQKKLQKEIKMRKMEDFQEKVIIKSKVQKEIEEA
jgi:hypothetical protein